MKYSFLKASLLIYTTFNLTNNLANASGFIDIGGGMNKFKIKNIEVSKKSPSLTLGVGANIDLNEKTFLTLGFEASANFGEAKNEYTGFKHNTYTNNLGQIHTSKARENIVTKTKNSLSNFLYLGLGFKVNDKFKVYGKLGLAHEMANKNSTSNFTTEQNIYKPMNFIINGVQTTINNLMSSFTTTQSRSVSEKYNFIGFGYGIGASYEISSSKALNLEYLAKNTSSKKNGSKTKMNNQVIKVSYRMFF